MNYRFASRIVGYVGVTAVVSMLGISSLTASAQAGEQTMSGRYANLKADSKCSKLDDVEGHFICTFEVPSVAISDGGEIRSRVVRGTLNLINGTGPAHGYSISTYPDGSMITSEWEGTGKVNDQDVRELAGTYKCVAGSGRYKGVKCEGTWTSSVQKGGFTLGSYKGTMTLPD